MADQLGSNNTQQRLIASGSQVQRTARPTARKVNRNDDSVIVNSSEKRYLWTARAFAVVAAISICCNLILLLTISNILPLYRVEPYLLTLTNKNEQVYRIVPFARDLGAMKSITETYVREYLLLRTTLLPDIDEMKVRWGDGGDLQEMSSTVVYQDFIKNTGSKLIQRIKQEELTSSVKILTVNEIEDGTWQVEYDVYYRRPIDVEPKKLKYRATMKIQYQRQRVQYKDRLKNPVGFKVVSYGTKQLKKQNN